MDQANDEDIARKKRAENMKKYRIKKGITKGHIKMTEEQKREKARLRKQKSREEAKKNIMLFKFYVIVIFMLLSQKNIVNFSFLSHKYV